MDSEVADSSSEIFFKLSDPSRFDLNSITTGGIMAWYLKYKHKNHLRDRAIIIEVPLLAPGIEDVEDARKEAKKRFEILTSSNSMTYQSHPKLIWKEEL